MTLFDSMCLRPVGCTLRAVAQSELEAITMGTGGWEGCEDSVQSERGKHVLHVAEARKLKPDAFCCGFLV